MKHRILMIVGIVALFSAQMQPVFAQGRRGGPGMSKLDRREAGTLKEGDLAPDFELKEIGKKNKVKLSSFRGKKPVVLIFGSYT